MAKTPGVQTFKFHKTITRVADRFTPDVATAWVRALSMFEAGINEKALNVALASKNMAAIDKAIGGSRFGQMMQALEPPLARTIGTAGSISQEVLGAGGIEFAFNAVHPDVVAFARDQSAALVVDVADDVKEATRIVIATGAQQGLTIPQQARAIREIVGLPPNWAKAPLHFADELKRGAIASATSRRLSATDKAQIRSRAASGTMTDTFIKNMQTRYSDSLKNLRGLNIARTESIRAANFGVQNSWDQALKQGALGKGSRKFWLPTPDERLSEQHATIPSLNPKGRKLDEKFITTEGRHMYPPSRPNCRCGVALRAVPGKGVLPKKKGGALPLLPPTGIGGGAGTGTGAGIGGAGVGAGGVEYGSGFGSPAFKRAAAKAAATAKKRAAALLKARAVKAAKRAKELAAEQAAKAKRLAAEQAKKAKALAAKAKKAAAEKKEAADFAKAMEKAFAQKAKKDAAAAKKAAKAQAEKAKAAAAKAKKKASKDKAAEDALLKFLDEPLKPGASSLGSGGGDDFIAKKAMKKSKGKQASAPKKPADGASLSEWFKWADEQGAW